MRGIAAVVFFVVAFAVFVGAAQAGPFVGVFGGPAYGSVDAPSMRVAPDSVVVDDSGFAAGIKFGYSVSSWSAALTFGKVDKLGASTYRNTGIRIVNSEASFREIDDSFLSATVGKSFPIGGLVHFDLNAGAVYWKTETTDRFTTSTSDSKTGQILSLSQTVSSSDHNGLSGTAGAALVARDGNASAYVGVQYYGGLKMTVPMVGVSVAF